MNNIWLQVLAVMIGGSLAKYLFVNPWVWAVIDLAVLGISYLILRRHPYIDMKNSMLFLGCLTLVAVLTDLRIISDALGNIIILVLLAWMMFGNRNNGSRKRPIIRHKWHK